MKKIVAPLLIIASLRSFNRAVLDAFFRILGRFLKPCDNIADKAYNDSSQAKLIARSHYNVHARVAGVPSISRCSKGRFLRYVLLQTPPYAFAHSTQKSKNLKSFIAPHHSIVAQKFLPHSKNQV